MKTSQGPQDKKGHHSRPRRWNTCAPCSLRLLSLLRYERLEDQLHDLTELHQHETANLKQELASAEEKVAYQAYERSRDIQVWVPSWADPGVGFFQALIHSTA